MSPMACLRLFGEMPRDFAREQRVAAERFQPARRVDAVRERRARHARDDHRQRIAAVEPALAGVEERVLGQRAPRRAMRGLHIVVMDFEVRPQHDARLAARRNAAQALPQIGSRRARGDRRERIRDDLRMAARERERVDRASRARRRVRRAYLLLELRLRRREQHAGCAGHGAFAAQFEHRALQVVFAARREQRLPILRVALKAHVHVMRDPIARARRGDAQMVERRAGAEPNIRVQILRERRVAAGGVLVRLHEHAMHARHDVDHDERRFGAPLRRQPQLQHRGRALRGAAADTQSQARFAQRAMRPEKRRGVIVRRRRQVREQRGALGAIRGAEPACVDLFERAGADGREQPGGVRGGARRARRVRSVGFGVEPCIGRGRRQMAERFVVARDPAVLRELGSRGGPVGGGRRHRFRPARVRPSARSPWLRCRGRARDRRIRRCARDRATAPYRARALRSSADNARRSRTRCLARAAGRSGRPPRARRRRPFPSRSRRASRAAGTAARAAAARCACARRPRILRSSNG
ncbi:hypothetical protein BURPS1710b_2824 [Burkholderia pseudomallei 1710b]|uniref:Uncharacterized protein n=1 Tax=Burkholderia pseudomallei (strain 1710b) TaxID=320372 RepID=Q3JQE5_BURP1|nr:hypothetical protein BURPS1710b_2824 [Burkholderia pseudomallei 1710b]